MIENNKEINVTLMGSPQEFKEAKVVLSHKGVERVYDPKKYIIISDRTLTSQAMHDLGVIRVPEEQIKIKMIFHMGCTSDYKGRRLMGKLFDRRGNIDLMKKYYMSIMDGIVFENRSQVEEVEAKMIYSKDKFTEIFISRI